MAEDKTDNRLMSMAVTMALKGWGTTSPNPMVGAVIAKDGRVISKGYHARAGGPHAEIAAIDQAGPATRGADLYVTLEPCHHHGRTPPCTQAILAAGLKNVIIGCQDPNPKVQGGGADFLAARGLGVKIGVREERCRELIAFFCKYATTGLPYVILKSAATMDGKIATNTGHSRWVTGEKARAWVHWLRSGVDAILVGRGTVAKDDPTLNVRLPRRRSVRQPWRIVVDTRLGLPPTAKIFDRETGGKTVVACGPAPDEAKSAVLRDLGIEVWPLPINDGQVSLQALIERLGQREITSLLIEGGAALNYSALILEKIVDLLYFFYAPKIIGGEQAPTLVDGRGLRTMDEAIKLEIMKIKALGPDIMVEAQPRY